MPWEDLYSDLPSPDGLLIPAFLSASRNMASANC